jgi:hypothetical protein
LVNDTQRRQVYKLPCKYCGAEAHKPCHRPSGAAIKDFHAPRIDAWLKEKELEATSRREEPVLEDMTFLQRAFSALKDIADLEALQESWGPEEMSEIVNRWSTDDNVVNLDAASSSLGMDQLKILNAIARCQISEAEIEAGINNAMTEAEAYAEMAARQRIDPIDAMVESFDHNVDATEQAIAYMTAVLSQDGRTSHEIINEQGCTLVHVLTGWFLNYMIGRETLPYSNGELDDIELLRGHFAVIAMENAKASVLTTEEKRRMAKRTLGFIIGDEESEE